MRLSVIVPTFLMSQSVADLWARNRARLLEVASVPTELIVVDNGSAYPPAEITVAWPKNRGIAPAWNEGRRHATGAVVAFVTCTTQVDPGWDAKLCAVAESGRFIAMPFTDGAQPYGIGVTGWCWAIRRALADEVGEFDETFVPAQYEDTDFFHRAIYQHQIELVNVAGATVTRPGGGGLTTRSGPFAERWFWLHFANRCRYGWKHNVDPNDVPPFWKQPLRTVSA